jgi:hypothetical protein
MKPKYMNAYWEINGFNTLFSQHQLLFKMHNRQDKVFHNKLVQLGAVYL